MDRAPAQSETIADMLYPLLGLCDLLTAAAITFPKPDIHGAGAMAELKTDKFGVAQIRYASSRFYRLSMSGIECTQIKGCLSTGRRGFRMDGAGEI